MNLELSGREWRNFLWQSTQREVVRWDEKWKVFKLVEIDVGRSSEFNQRQNMPKISLNDYEFVLFEGRQTWSSHMFTIFQFKATLLTRICVANIFTLVFSSHAIYTRSWLEEAWTIFLKFAKNTDSIKFFVNVRSIFEYQIRPYGSAAAWNFLDDHITLPWDQNSSKRAGPTKAALMVASKKKRSTLHSQLETFYIHWNLCWLYLESR